ncbi:MAG: BrnA antitoxin family protein [Zetaproteobacteria bacterium]|nr:BrnA antitoxin family protein [Zetaproteobacteria bacterium]
MSDKVEYGKHDIGDLDMKKAKAKVTIYLDGDVLEAVQSEAERTGTKYQPLLNQALRERFLGEKTVLQRLDAIESRLAKLG